VRIITKKAIEITQRSYDILVDKVGFPSAREIFFLRFKTSFPVATGMDGIINLMRLGTL